MIVTNKKKFNLIKKGIIFILIFFIWSAYPVQDMVARVMGYLNNSDYNYQLFNSYVKYLPSPLLVHYLKDGNFYLRGSAAGELCKRMPSSKKYFSEVKKVSRKSIHKFSDPSYELLACLNPELAIKVYREDLNVYPVDSDEYGDALRNLVRLKVDGVSSQLEKYVKVKWKSGVSYLLEEYGDPTALPALYDLKKVAEIELKNGVAHVKFGLERINQAIVTLEFIKKQHRDDNGDNGTPSDGEG